ncbi:MAG: DNA polymerase III subunit beta [Acholeplasmatales bacterium]|nr:DNA polymerase III subunit beta [Acholeplasmatales bacterium]
MIFSIDRDVLLDNLNMISHGLPVRTPMPILTGILMEATDNDLYLTSSNVDLSVETVISDKSLEIKEKGKAVVPGKFFIDIIRKVNSKKITFSLIEDRILLIETDKGEYKLHLMDYMDYPTVEFVVLENPLTVSAEALRKIIHQTVFATSTSESNPILTGVNFNLKNNTLTCIATDSYRLSQTKLALNDSYNDFSITIPSKSLDELNKALDQSNEEVSLYFSTNKLLFKFKNVLFQTRLLDGQYPNTSRLIPESYPMTVFFNKDELIESVERVSLLSPHDKVSDRETNYSVIKLEIKNDKSIEISTTNAQIGDAKEEIIPTRLDTTETLKIGFSARYLLDALRCLSSTEVALHFSGEIRPVVVDSEKESELTQLILPIRMD